MKQRNTTPNDNVTLIVRTLLAYRGRQQADLAEYLGMDTGSVSRALNGKRKWTLDDLVSMADFFDVSAALFFEDPHTLIRAANTPHGPEDPDGGGVTGNITQREFATNFGENSLDRTLLQMAA